MVHQHFTLADNLSVLDNVMLGTEPLWQPFSRPRAPPPVETGARFGLGVDLTRSSRARSASASASRS